MIPSKTRARYFSQPLVARYQRLLALIERNLDKLDETDQEIYLEARTWHYENVGNKGQKNGESVL